MATELIGTRLQGRVTLIYVALHSFSGGPWSCLTHAHQRAIRGCDFPVVRINEIKL